MTTLREETIKGLRKEGTFDMGQFCEAKILLKKNKARKNYCGTPSCIAGHIVAAAARLERKIPKDLLREEYHNFETGELEEPGRDLTDRLGLTYDDAPTARVARYVWARSYGVDSANKLDFYGNVIGDHTADDWGYTDLDSVTPEMAIQHLESV